VTTPEPTRIPPRVLLAKSFIDSHDRAIETIAKVLRDAGMEVILLDYELARQVSSAADQEDVDVIGVSFMSGGQVEVTKELFRSMQELGVADIPVVVGGTIRPFDVEELEGAGVKAIFRGGESLDSIVKTFADLAEQSRN
jgi:methylmalonyl-CoA mutase cobalamin-binding domain/chain